jgi:4-hydroxybenzoate polyprenyltransferase
MIHLGLNDFIDFKNDLARGMKSIPVLYGLKGTLYWITGFTLLHFLTTALFLKQLGVIAHYGFLAAVMILTILNVYLWKEKSTKAGMRLLPLFHLTLIIYTISIILDSLFFIH